MTFQWFVRKDCGFHPEHSLCHSVGSLPAHWLSPGGRGGGQRAHSTAVLERRLCGFTWKQIWGLPTTLWINLEMDRGVPLEPCSETTLAGSLRQPHETRWARGPPAASSTPPLLPTPAKNAWGLRRKWSAQKWHFKMFSNFSPQMLLQWCTPSQIITTFSISFSLLSPKYLWSHPWVPPFLPTPYPSHEQFLSDPPLKTSLNGTASCPSTAPGTWLRDLVHRFPIASSLIFLLLLLPSRIYAHHETQSNPMKMLVHDYQPPTQSHLVVSISLRGKAHVLKKGFISYFSLFGHLILVTLVCLLFLKLATYDSTSGPLHSLFLLPETLFFQVTALS